MRLIPEPGKPPPRYYTDRNVGIAAAISGLLLLLIVFYLVRRDRPEDPLVVVLAAAAATTGLLGVGMAFTQRHYEDARWRSDDERWDLLQAELAALRGLLQQQLEEQQGTNRLLASDDAESPRITSD
jgi:hypothetical protein